MAFPYLLSMAIRSLTRPVPTRSLSRQHSLRYGIPRGFGPKRSTGSTSVHTVKGQSIVWLLNVRSLTVPQAEALFQFVEEGGSVVFAAGDRNQAGWYPGIARHIEATTRTRHVG